MPPSSGFSYSHKVETLSLELGHAHVLAIPAVPAEGNAESPHHCVPNLQVLGGSLFFSLKDSEYGNGLGVYTVCYPARLPG